MTPEPTKRDLLSLWDLGAQEFLALLARADVLHKTRGDPASDSAGALAGKALGMIFEKPSTRTRVAFEVAMAELGGHAVYLAPTGTHLGRGEPLADTARVLAGYCHGIVIRTFDQGRAEELARYASVPVINGLTDQLHPCQIVADLLTVLQLRHDVIAPRYAWVGDGNNMAASWINAAAILGLHLALACPPTHAPEPNILERAQAHIGETGRGSVTVTNDPAAAVKGADVVSTDVWASMGQEDEAVARQQVFADFRVDNALLAHASSDAMVLHCLPAHRGEEISAEVLDGPQSAVWQQAENRLHTQKAILELFVGARG